MAENLQKFYMDKLNQCIEFSDDPVLNTDPNMVQIQTLFKACLKNEQRQRAENLCLRKKLSLLETGGNFGGEVSKLKKENEKLKSGFGPLQEDLITADETIVKLKNDIKMREFVIMVGSKKMKQLESTKYDMTRWSDDESSTQDEPPSDDESPRFFPKPVDSESDDDDFISRPYVGPPMQTHEARGPPYYVKKGGAGGKRNGSGRKKGDVTPPSPNKNTMDVPTPDMVCAFHSGCELFKYEFTSVYQDKDTYFKFESEDIAEVVSKMIDIGSVACMKFGKCGGKYIMKSPASESHFKSPKGELVKRGPGMGGDYDSIIKNLKHNASCIKKNCHTFVLKLS